MTIVEEIDKKSGRPHRSKNITDALKYLFKLDKTPQNISEAVKGYSGGSDSGDVKKVLFEGDATFTDSSWLFNLNETDKMDLSGYKSYIVRVEGIHDFPIYGIVSSASSKSTDRYYFATNKYMYSIHGLFNSGTPNEIYAIVVSAYGAGNATKHIKISLLKSNDDK